MSFSTLRMKAEDLGIVVLGTHYAALPSGCSRLDSYGNSLQCTRVWLGKRGLKVGDKKAVYSDIVHSIHDVASPNVADALWGIKDCLERIQAFPQRAEYVEEMLPYAGGKDPVTIANAWTESLDCSLRATRNLPGAMIESMLLY